MKTKEEDDDGDKKEDDGDKEEREGCPLFLRMMHLIARVIRWLVNRFADVTN